MPGFSQQHINMKADISFEFAKVYDVDTVDIVMGQKFSILTDHDGPSQWFTDNDKVLSVDVNENIADLEATSIGKSTILIMNPDLLIIKKITINVVEKIVQPAADLGVSADEPVLKDQNV